MYRFNKVYRFDHFRLACAVLLAASSLFFPAWLHAEGPTYAVGLGFEFASGRYGTDTRTDSVYLPVTASVCPTERLGLSIEVPYVYQSSSAVNTGVYAGSSGQMMHMQKITAAMTGMGAGSMSSATAGSSAQSQIGLGDITVKGAFVLVQEGDLMPRVRPSVSIKLPTADSNKALGTGAFDEGFAVEFSKQLGNWYTFAEAGYLVQGKSPVLDLENYLTYNAGAGYAVGEQFLPMLILKGSTAPVAGSGELLEVRLKLKYQSTERTGIEGYLSKGITSNSPEYGSGLAVFYNF